MADQYGYYKGQYRKHTIRFLKLSFLVLVIAFCVLHYGKIDFENKYPVLLFGYAGLNGIILAVYGFYSNKLQKPAKVKPESPPSPES